MRFLLSFIATIADLVARLSPIPAASFPSVVPLHGQMTTASISAEPDADLAAMSLLSSSIAPVRSASCSGVSLQIRLLGMRSPMIDL